MRNRREVIGHSATVAVLLAGAGWLPRLASAEALPHGAFDAKTLDEFYKTLGAAKPAESNLVTLVAPEIAENGAVVRMRVATTAPNVKKLLLLIEKNPNVLSASFDVSPAIEPDFQVNVKMGQTSSVYAVALTTDNKVLFAQKEVKVTLGGCGG
ncbi:MAG: thiosulfate oxidation carrier protein SoxY [Pelomonas sp.]|nr:thiosulfate oxidation carrier protein SoxY [Roseateles sp.]